jgi:hypothetical protein
LFIVQLISITDNNKELHRNMMINSKTICPEVIFSPATDDEIGSVPLLKKKRVTSPKRKFSFPAALHSSSLLLSETNAIGRTTRRLSNVSDRVTDRVRKLSTAIWNQAPSKDILLLQSHALITLYIRYRLRRSGILSHQRKKISLQKMRSTLLGCGAEVREVYFGLREVKQKYKQLLLNDF